MSKINLFGVTIIGAGPSGVTLAMHLAMLAAEVVDKPLSKKVVAWQQNYTVALAKCFETFKHFVMSWYDTSWQDVIFFSDEENPYVSNTKRRLNVLAKICQDETTTAADK